MLPRRVVVSRLLTQLLNYAYYYEEVLLRRLIQVSWLNLNFIPFFSINGNISQ